MVQGLRARGTQLQRFRWLPYSQTGPVLTFRCASTVSARGGGGSDVNRVSTCIVLFYDEP